MGSIDQIGPSFCTEDKKLYIDSIEIFFVGDDDEVSSRKENLYHIELLTKTD